jgi:uncharacterized protein
MAHGQITHIEFPADDTERARRFYGELFGWQFREMEGSPGYFLFSAGTAEIGGAIGERGRSAADRLRVVCEVDSIDVALERAPGLGGAVIAGKSDIPGVGFYAVIGDTEGNEVGLFEGLGQG